MHRRRPSCPADAGGERNLLGANRDAILRITTDLNAPFFHQGVQTLASVVVAGRMSIEEHRLANGMSADEGFVISGGLAGLELFVGFAVVPFNFCFDVLRAGIQAAATAHAFGKGISNLLISRALPRAGAHVDVTVDGNPGFDLLQGPEKAAAVNYQIADDGEFRHRLEFDFAGAIRQQLVHEGGAALPHLAVDDHRASAADFFQTVAIPGDRCDLFAVAGRGPGRNPLQHAYDIHIRLILHLVPFPVAGLARAVLPQYADFERIRRGMPVAVMAMIGGSCGF